MKTELDALHIKESSIHTLCEEYRKNNQIDPKMYEAYSVKRGLRNADGTGVLAGLTNICNVHGYVINEGEREPVEGWLSYRGINVEDIVAGCVAGNRFGFEETVYLLLFGQLPTREELERFMVLMGKFRDIPPTFFEDMILKAPSPDVMNKLGRSVLSLYSYDDAPEDRSLESELGKAIALKLAENGADVAIIFVGPEQPALETKGEIEALGRKAVCYECDVRDEQAVEDTVAQVKKDLGKVDILVNNAGITRDGLMVTMKDEDYDMVLDINLKGAFHMIRACYRDFMRKRSGKIINISSIAGLVGNVGQVNYAASKAGLIGLSKSVAKELGSRGVCCNCIAPGFIETAMTKDIKEDNPLLVQVPMKKMGTPEDVANVALFLASPESDYITGETIRVDGGLAI